MTALQGRCVYKVSAVSLAVSLKQYHYFKVQPRKKLFEGVAEI